MALLLASQQLVLGTALTAPLHTFTAWGHHSNCAGCEQNKEGKKKSEKAPGNKHTYPMQPR